MRTFLKSALALFLGLSLAQASVTNTNNTITYSGNGATTHFTYTYPLQHQSDLQVWITDAAGNQTELTTNYQVDTVNAQVIYPTSGAALPAGSKITILRVVPLTQTVTLNNNGPLPSKTLEQAYDKLTMAQQQIGEQLGRTLQFPVDTAPGSISTSTLLADILASSGNAILAQQAASSAAAILASLGVPISIAKGGTNSTTALNNGYFMQSTGGKIVESPITVASFSGFLPGMSIDYRGTSPPAGWLFEDGSAVSRATFSALFAVIGTTYGSGDGSTTFNLPDSRGRVNVGSGTGPGLSARSVGQAFGEETHTLTIPEMPTHNHTIGDPGHSHAYFSQTAATFNSGGFHVPDLDAPRGSPNTGGATTGITINPAGLGGAHNNMQPSIVALRIVKI